MTFEYQRDPDKTSVTNDCFILRIPPKMETKAALLRTISERGCFPEYFGENWDALLDCLRDFSWISQKQIVILHTDVPIREDLDDCEKYLQILQLAVADWAAPNILEADEITSEWQYVPHQLCVIFAESDREYIERVLIKNKLSTPGVKVK